MPAIVPKIAPRLTQHILYGPRHLQFRHALGQFIDKGINPFVDEWESKKQFPAHVLFKQLGLLGIFGDMVA
ncbi:unnamed protein product [Gongylonema pulchrum]|uniref:Acyl-CoA_dh_N domain-containing protein n=1 Tax=Gongylonema pulchrum TaxID=637853 RepID=A0A183D693_9BILA|nr:unnamed protein product [Gongylonema pulchrum]